MTLRECKDKIAQENEYSDWFQIENLEISNCEKAEIRDMLYDRVCELYASELNRRVKELEEELGTLGIKALGRIKELEEEVIHERTIVGKKEVHNLAVQEAIDENQKFIRDYTADTKGYGKSSAWRFKLDSKIEALNESISALEKLKKN